MNKFPKPYARRIPNIRVTHVPKPLRRFVKAECWMFNCLRKGTCVAIPSI